jgi:type IV pilus assembly protein PilA
VCVLVKLFLKGKKIMRSRKGFTLIELMVVIIIVAVLAAVVVPLLLSRIEKARASEGKAIASQIATAVRAWAVEQDGTPAAAPVLTTNLGFKTSELEGKYYTQTGSGVTGVSLDPVTGLLSYIVTVASKDTTKAPTVTLTCTNNVTVITPQ